MNISSWLVDTVTVQRYEGRTEYGDPVYGPQFTIKARVESTQNLVRGTDGEERTSSQSMASNVALNLKDRAWLPGKDTSKDDQSLMPIAVQTAANKSGSYRFHMSFF